MGDPSSYLRPLRKDDYLVASFGDAAGSVPYVVRRATPYPLVYDLVKQGVISTSLAASTFVDNQLLGLSATVTNIAGVNDIFLIQQNFELLQVWWGIAPRPTRVWAKQPYGQFVGVLDQNINPSGTYPDIGYVDGFLSPFGRPSRSTELTIFKGIPVNWALYNPAPWPVNPRLYFYVNKMMVKPVTDPATAVALVTRKLPAHHVSIGNPSNTVAYDPTSYGDVKPISEDDLLGGTTAVTSHLKAKGYC